MYVVHVHIILFTGFIKKKMQRKREGERNGEWIECTVYVFVFDASSTDMEEHFFSALLFFIIFVQFYIASKCNTPINIYFTLPRFAIDAKTEKKREININDSSAY